MTYMKYFNSKLPLIRLTAISSLILIFRSESFSLKPNLLLYENFRLLGYGYFRNNEDSLPLLTTVLQNGSDVFDYIARNTTDYLPLLSYVFHSEESDSTSVNMHIIRNAILQIGFFKFIVQHFLRVTHEHTQAKLQQRYLTTLKFILELMNRTENGWTSSTSQIALLALVDRKDIANFVVNNLKGEITASTFVMIINHVNVETSKQL